MKFLALCLLFVGAAVATSIGGFGEIGDQGRISLGVEPFLNTIPHLPLLKSAPGVVQPEYHHISYDETPLPFDEYGVPEVPHEEYGPPPEPHEEYGPPPEPHEEYGPPLERIQPIVTTEHYCPEEDFKSEFLREPPVAPEIIPLPEVPILKFEEPIYVPETPHEEYGPPEVPHEEYGPPPVPVPLCPNGAPDTSYPFCCVNGAVNPFCCENGATNEFCCLGEYINPTCSAPPTEAPVVKLAPYPPKRLCTNDAEDVTYPYCCENGAVNEWCCLGEYINPTCSAPITEPPVPVPLCPNGAPDVSYPFCCVNGATNPYCCDGQWINPTCSEPTTTTVPPPTTTVSYAPYPARRLCVNGAEDSTYPYCCENGAINEWCCVGEYINPTCSAPTTTTTTTTQPPPPPPTVKLAPYPPPTTTTTTTTTPVPIIPKSKYPAKVESHYDGGRTTFQASASIGGGKTGSSVQVTAESTKGVIPHSLKSGNGPIVGQHGITVKGIETDAHARIVTGRNIEATPIHTFRIVKPVITFRKRFVRNPIKNLLHIFG